MIYVLSRRYVITNGIYSGHSVGSTIFSSIATVVGHLDLNLNTISWILYIVNFLLISMLPYLITMFSNVIWLDKTSVCTYTLLSLLLYITSVAWVYWVTVSYLMNIAIVICTNSCLLEMDDGIWQSCQRFSLGLVSDPWSVSEFP